MMNIEVPAYWHLDTSSKLSTEEIEYQEKMVKNVVYFSDLLSGHVWTTGTSGSLNVDRVWPAGSDEVQGLGAHNGYLIIFGKRQILVYENSTVVFA